MYMLHEKGEGKWKKNQLYIYTCVLLISNMYMLHEKGEGEWKKNNYIYTCILLISNMYMLHEKGEGEWKKNQLYIYLRFTNFKHVNYSAFTSHGFLKSPGKFIL